VSEKLIKKIDGYEVDGYKISARYGSVKEYFDLIQDIPSLKVYQADFLYEERF